jgi:hypothetical protein
VLRALNGRCPADRGGDAKVGVMSSCVPDDSTVLAVLCQTRIVNRESFEIPTLDPLTGRVDGSISAHEFAARMLAAFGHGPDDEGQEVEARDAAASA